jgi:DNA-binding transcriptional LysR family regulator
VILAAEKARLTTTSPYRETFQSRSRSFAYFEAVARSGSMRKAALTLNVASSALNRKILDLETDLGVKLFERLPRGVRLTSSGELLLGHVRRTGRDLDSTRAQIEDLRGLRRGHIRLAVVEAVMGGVAKLIVASQRSQPRITFDCAVMSSREVVSAVAREEVDIGYAFNPPPDRGFLAVSEAVQPLQALMARTHPLAGYAKLRLSDCVQYPILLGSEGLGGRQLLNAAADEASVSLRPAVTGNSIDFLKSVAAESEGVCFQLMPDATDKDQLVAIPLTDAGLRGRLVIGVKKGRQLPSAAAVFLEKLKGELVPTELPSAA